MDDRNSPHLGKLTTAFTNEIVRSVPIHAAFNDNTFSPTNHHLLHDEE
jgi:hypothetical protein